MPMAEGFIKSGSALQRYADRQSTPVWQDPRQAKVVVSRAVQTPPPTLSAHGRFTSAAVQVWTQYPPEKTPIDDCSVMQALDAQSLFETQASPLRPGGRLPPVSQSPVAELQEAAAPHSRLELQGATQTERPSRMPQT